MTQPPSRHAMTFVFLTVLIDSIGFGVTLPVMPDLIVELEGGTLAEAAVVSGWLLTIFALMQVLFGPLIGNLSDRFGRRPILLFSLIAFGLDYALMAFAPNLVWLFIGRAVAGVAGAIYGPANAYIADITPPEKRAQNFGILGAAFGAGFILGPAMGGLLGELGPRAPFFAAAALALANAVYGFVVLPETLPKEKRRPFELARANPLGAMGSLGHVPSAMVLMTAFFLWALASQVYPVTWSFFAAVRFDWSPSEIGYSLAFVGVTMILVQFFLIGRAVAVLGERNALLVGLISGMIGFLGCAIITEGWMVYVVFTLSALSGFVYPSMNAILSAATPEDQQGELQGAMASINSLSEVVGPVMLSQMFGYFSGAVAPVFFPGAPYLLAALFAALSGLIVLSRVKGRKEEPHAVTS